MFLPLCFPEVAQENMMGEGYKLRDWEAFLFLAACTYFSVSRLWNCGMAGGEMKVVIGLASMILQESFPSLIILPPPLLLMKASERGQVVNPRYSH